MITVCRLLGGGASLSMLHEAPVPKERNEGSEEHAQPLSLVALLHKCAEMIPSSWVSPCIPGCNVASEDAQCISGT